MDKAIESALGPWTQLGVVGSVVISLAVIGILLWRKLEASQQARLDEAKAFAKQTLDAAVANIHSNNKLADAFEGLQRLLEAALKKGS